MVLSLISPVSSNFIKDWPAQNEVNCDRIDEFAGAQCLTGHPLGLYTPVLSASVTAPTIGTGAGAIQGYYYKIFDQIWVWAYFRFGTGFNAGSGVYSMSLPFTAKTLNIQPNVTMGGGPIVGEGFVWDDSSSPARQPVSVQLRTTTTVQFGLRMTSGAVTRDMTNIAPITWAQDDSFKFFARYQRA